MNTTIVPITHAASRPNRAGLLDNWARKLILRQLAGLSRGGLTIVDGESCWQFGSSGDLRATLRVRDGQFWRDLALGGSLGAAESYIQNRWNTDDLTTLCRVFARNLDLSDKLETGWAKLGNSAAKAFHWMHRNSRRGSAKNIHAHYDLGNKFFQLFLDETMNYSCGIFEMPGATMRQASVAKMERACRKLALGPRDHLLEIGSGWGALALHAAKHFGCRVTTTTVSPEQYELARQRVRQAGLENRIEVLLHDYRDLQGQFDKIVSIEMIEAVGHNYLPTYFGKCGSLLKPDGMMLLQGITMAEHRYETYRKSVDFIQRYVFPGSCLPSLSAMTAAIASSSDLRPVHLEDLTPHYAETLRRWRAGFFSNLDAVRALGYPGTFIRLWEFYLCYCEAGFEERTVGDVQLLLAKPRSRMAPILPALN